MIRFLKYLALILTAAAVLTLSELILVKDAKSAEVSVGAGLLNDNNYDYKRSGNSQSAANMQETGRVAIQGSITETVKYGFSHSSLFYDIDADKGENIIFLAYQVTLIKVIYVSAAIGIIDNLGEAHKIGLSPRRDNPVVIFTWRHPVAPCCYNRLAYTTSLNREGERYQTLYMGVEYLFNLGD